MIEEEEEEEGGGGVGVGVGVGVDDPSFTASLITAAPTIPIAMAVGIETPKIVPAAASEATAASAASAASTTSSTAASATSACAKLAGETDNAIATAMARSFFLNISYPHPFFETLSVIHL